MDSVQIELAVGNDKIFIIVNNRRAFGIKLFFTGDVVSADQKSFPLYEGFNEEDKNRINNLITSGRFTIYERQKNTVLKNKEKMEEKE